MRKRKFVNVFVSTIILVGVVGSLGVLGLALDVPVEHIKVEGALTEAELDLVKQAVAKGDVRGILSTDIEGLREHLEDLDWAQELSVRRTWPKTLTVAVSRAEPVARWGAHQYLSSAGALLDVPDERPGLPLFEVAIAAPAEAMSVYRLLHQLGSSDALEIATLSQDPQGSWRVGYAQGFEVSLGVSHLDTKMKRFLKVYRQLADDEKRFVYADARYGSGVAVRFDNDATEEVLIARAK